VGTTCSGTIYKDKPPDNSPENARGLGSFGFADLEYAMCFNCALAKHCPYVDPLRKTKLRKRDRKSTHLLHLPAHPALVGAY
jgi:hypothetical protein